MRTDRDPQPMGTEAHTPDAATSQPASSAEPAALAEARRLQTVNPVETTQAEPHPQDENRPGGLPSIIIDPSLSDPPAAPQPTPGAVSPVSQPSDAALDGAMADRFAAAFRPSWEPTAPSAPVARTASISNSPSARSSLAPSPSHRPTVGAAVMSSTRPQDEQLVPVTRARNRALIWTGLSVVGFLVLAYLGISSSSRSGGPHPTQVASNAAPAQAAVPAPVNEAPAAAAPAPSTPQPTAADPVPAPSSPTAAPNEPAPGTLAPSEPAPSAPSPQPVAPTTAWLHVATQPSSAELSVDGQRVGNPFDQELPLGTDHQLEARAAGHASQQRSVRIGADTKLTLVLAAVEAPAPRPIPRPVAARPAPRPAPARVVIKHKPTPAPAHPAAKPKRGAGFVADSPY